MKQVIIAALLSAAFAAACGGNSPMAPSAAMSVAGNWVGSASDSSSSIGAAGMMGQAGMGTMTWQVTQNGSSVTGSMSFSGMPGRMGGSLSATMSGSEMTFSMDLPMGSMMSSGCTAHATGVAHISGSMMTGTYTGSNSCSGPFTNGQMTMAHR